MKCPYADCDFSVHENCWLTLRALCVSSGATFFLAMSMTCYCVQLLPWSRDMECLSNCQTKWWSAYEKRNPKTCFGEHVLSAWLPVLRRQETLSYPTRFPDDRKWTHAAKKCQKCMPNRPFYNFSGSISVDPRFWTTQSFWNNGFIGPKIVKDLVGKDYNRVSK